jgi:hypothetical protein
MAEPQGISRTFQDIGNFGKGVVKSVLDLNQDLLNREAGFKRGADQAIDNVVRYFRSQEGKPLDFSPVGSKPTAAKPAYTGPRSADAAERWTSGTPSTTTVPSRNVAAPGGAGMGGAPAVNPIEALFAPMFESLAQREQQANQRYEANAQQVTNIYGQITGARTADIATTGEAFRRLSDAASARSTAVNTSIDEAEAARLRNNQAALESMGLGALSTAQGDIASQGAATAKNTNTLNAENWQGLLTAMGATAQDIARADVTGFNYRMGEDLGQLRGARETFADQLGQERAGLVTQQAQATFEYQQAQQAAAASAASAAQRAATDASDQVAKQQAEALKGSGPVTQVIANRFNLGLLSPTEAAKATNAINEWFASVPPPAGSGKWNSGSAKNSILGLAKGSLSKNEQDAIVAVFDAMTW